MKTTSRPCFSVVIPLYNKSPHVARSVGSVLNQTFGDFELIVVNDASTDGSAKELHLFNDPRIRVLQREKPGPGGYAARNLGIENARSEWVAFLDADDKWHPHHLACYHDLIRQFPDAKVLGCGWEVYDPERSDKFVKERYFIKQAVQGNHECSLDQYLWFMNHKLAPICSSIACIRKTILQEAGGFPAGRTNRGGDLDVWLRCIARAGGYAWSAHSGGVYYRDAVNMVTRTQVSNVDVMCQTVRDLLKAHQGSDTAFLLKEYANIHVFYAWKESKWFKTPDRQFAQRLYRDVTPWRNLFWTLIFRLPDAVFFGLSRLKKRI
jgi:glycosyltransferase involved in cell wall biosynthesis